MRKASRSARSYSELNEPKNELVLTAAALVSAGSLAYTIAKDSFPILKSTEPIVFFIHDSKCINSEKNIHRAIFEVLNVARHGAYLEQIEIKSPENIEFKFSISDTYEKINSEKEYMMQATQVETSYGPILKPKQRIEGESRKFFSLEFPCPPLTSAFWKKPVGSAEFQLALLNETKERKTKLNFRLRRP